MEREKTVLVSPNLTQDLTGTMHTTTNSTGSFPLPVNHLTVPLKTCLFVSCRYSADLDMSHSRRGFQMQNSGQLKITYPNYDMSTTWQHRNSDDDLKTTLTSNWGRGKQLQVIWCITWAI